MARRQAFPSLSLAALLLCAGAAAALPSLIVQAAEEKYTAREQVGKPVQAAEQLLKQKNLKEALAKLRQAEAVPNKTPYELYIIAATRAGVDLAAGDYSGTIKELETVLSTRILAPAEALKRVETLAQLYYQQKNYPMAIQYVERYYEEGGKDETPRILAAQAYYLQNDFANAAKTCLALIRDNEKVGKPANESVLQLLANSEYQEKNIAGYVYALSRVVVTYPKKEYWRDLLLAIRKKPGFSSRLTLEVDRLMVATETMKTPEEYMEAAQLALSLGLPGDAKSFLDQGYATGVLGKGAEAERQQRLVAMASRQSADDIKGLVQLAQESDGANGLGRLKLGQAYSSHGQYTEAIAALQEGIQKGALKYPDDARLQLGRAYLGAGQLAQAKEVLSAVTAGDGTQDLARLWLILGGVK